MKYLFILFCVLIASCSDSGSGTDNELDENSLQKAIEALQSQNYDTAIEKFNDAIEDESVETQALAYAGLGFTQMNIYKLDDAFTSFETGLALNVDSAKNANLAGLCFIEFAKNKSFSNAISHGNNLLERDSEFSLLFGLNIDFKDIRLVMAQSFYALKLYEDCLKEVQRLGKLSELNSSDENIETHLLNALKILITEL